MPAKRRQRFVRYGLLGANGLILVLVGWFVVGSSQPTLPVNNKSLALSASGTKSITNPLDQVSSADIAVNVARMTNLPEATAVTNLADSQDAELTVVQTSAGLAAKPQVVASSFKSNKDINTYLTQSGDTVASIAAKFNVTSESVLWSNNLTGNQVIVGQKLYIPPVNVNGIVYVVKAGDTPESLAQKYRTTVDKIVAYNDAELVGLKVDERIIIPDGQIAASIAPTISRSNESATGFPWGGSGPVYGSNGYDYGYCTWYVASRIAVPTNWGNANTWDNLAPLSGWQVSTIPTPGAIAQTDRGSQGHVAIVEEVSVDGTMIKYSDMNGLAGWGHVGHSDWIAASHFEHYITH